MHNAYVSRVAMMDIFSCSTQSSCVKLQENTVKNVILCNILCTLKFWYNEPWYSEFCDIVKKPSSHFEDLLSILHLMLWKGSDGLVRYIKIWVYVLATDLYYYLFTIFIVRPGKRKARTKNNFWLLFPFFPFQ